MCLIAFAWNCHPRWRLVLLANRDEFHARPTASLARWDDAPQVVAGRDLEAGGTWLGVNTQGRMATVTNVRDPGHDGSGRSRGLLVSDYLRDTGSAAAWVANLHDQAVRYRPFNLLCFDQAQAWYQGNHPRARIEPVPPGVHGLSNADFNTPWPKTRAIKARLSDWLARGDDDVSPLWGALSDPGEWPDDMLPDTGVGIELERRLSAAFMRGRDYGTRASTLVTVTRDGAVTLRERRYGPDGAFQGETAMALDAIGDGAGVQ
ncbi:NRDE family protein [Oleiagrimonas sp.]|jgi:uncharacterized protein with NRDE domain|uniref:NRDE family protein n=1 Tax=Oleiagrimonas sp. TaxID=2010330 RepID=UPI0026043FBC|nr:NRDE family protein [Oleiagrimonas sp.]MDA3913710.1 NRDE family protein [Oleiagrimonas sp.]